MVNHIRPRIYLIILLQNFVSYHIYSSRCALSRFSFITLSASLNIWHHFLQPVNLPMCLSEVTFLLLHFWLMRFIGLQHCNYLLTSASHLVNIWVGSFRRALPIIVSCCAMHWRQSSNNLLKGVWTVKDDAVQWLSVPKPVFGQFGTFWDSAYFHLEMLWKNKLHLFRINQTHSIFPSSLWSCCSHNYYAPSRYTSVDTWHLPCLVHLSPFSGYAHRFSAGYAFHSVSQSARCHLTGYQYCRFMNSLVVSSSGAPVDPSPHTLVDSARDFIKGILIDLSPAAIFWLKGYSKVHHPSTSCTVIWCGSG